MSNLPNIFILGASKSGTTSLYEYLSNCSDVFIPKNKEIHYFSYEDLVKRVGGPGDSGVIDSCCESIETYKNHYSGSEGFKLVGDFSPSYFFYPETAVRILNICEAPKAIIVLRNPTDKAYSQYLHLVRNGREDLSFEEALNVEPERRELMFNDMWLYKESGYYYEKISNFLDVFGPGNLKVILFDDLKYRPDNVLDDICKFIGSSGPKSPMSYDVHNKGNSRPRFGDLSLKLINNNTVKRSFHALVPQKFKAIAANRVKSVILKPAEVLDKKLRDQLDDCFRDDIKRLEGLLGVDTGWAK